MKSKKGFSLIEIIAAIIILSIIVIISLGTYSSVAKSTKEQNRTSLIKRIELASEQYAEDYNLNLFFVDDLVTKGYLTPDDNSGDIIDPVSNNKINCYAVEVDNTNNSLNAKFIDEKDYRENGKCNRSNLSSNSPISIKILNADKVYNNWYKSSSVENPILKALDVNCDIDKNNCSWSSSLNGTLSETDDELEINYTLLNSVTYQFNYMINGKYSYGQILFNLDDEEPTITNINIENENELTKIKKVTIEANDGNGSGIKGYKAVSKEEECPSNLADYQKTEIEITNNGEYKVCVSDNVGNISESSSLKIENIIEEYKIIYHSNDENNESNTVTVLFGSDYELNQSFSRTGYSFSKWNTQSDGSGTSYSINEVINISKSDIEGVELHLYATWEINKYNIKFYQTSTTIKDTKTLEYGSYILSQAPKISNTSTANFIEWNTQSDGMGEKLDNNKKVTDSISYYAIYEYKVSFVSDEVVKEEKYVRQGNTLSTLPSNMTKENYDFLGWYTQSSGGTKITTSTVINSSKTYYAHWNLKKYNLKIIASNGTISNNNSSSYTETINVGTTNTYTITPNTGYKYSSMSCTGGSYDSSTNKLTITNPTSNITCNIYFTEDNLYGKTKSCLTSYNNPCYVKYGNRLWIVYGSTTENGGGVRMILDRNAGITSFSSTACCDTGICTYEKNNFTSTYIGTTTLTNFYNNLPTSKSSILLNTTYNTGYEVWNSTGTEYLENHLSEGNATSIIGIPSTEDSWLLTSDYTPFIKNTYEQFTWVSYLQYLSKQFYAITRAKFSEIKCNYNDSIELSTYPNINYLNSSNYSYLYFYSNSSCHFYPKDRNLYYRPVIVMKKTTQVASGSGTETNPFIVE